MSEQFFEGSGETQLFLRTWHPAGAVRAVLVAVHGFKAHSAVFEWCGNQLAQHGIAVYAQDLRGHGKSDGQRLAIGKFDDYVDDLGELIELATAREQHAPVYLLGHSAGGVIAATYALDHPEHLAGFICESFALEVPVPTFVLDLLKGLSHIAPRVGVYDLRPALFSRDRAFVEFMKSDPLIGRERYPSHTIAELVRADEELRSQLSRFELPVLILHGSADKVTRPHGSELFHAQAGSRDRTLRIYEGHYHDLLNDVDKEQVLADVQRWIDARVSARLGITEIPSLRPRPH